MASLKSPTIASNSEEKGRHSRRKEGKRLRASHVQSNERAARPRDVAAKALSSSLKRARGLRLPQRARGAITQTLWLLFHFLKIDIVAALAWRGLECGSASRTDGDGEWTDATSIPFHSISRDWRKRRESGIKRRFKNEEGRPGSHLNLSFAWGESEYKCENKEKELRGCTSGSAPRSILREIEGLFAIHISRPRDSAWMRQAGQNYPPPVMETTSSLGCKSFQELSPKKIMIFMDVLVPK